MLFHVAMRNYVVDRVVIVSQLSIDGETVLDYPGDQGHHKNPLREGKKRRQGKQVERPSQLWAWG